MGSDNFDQAIYQRKFIFDSKKEYQKNRLMKNYTMQELADLTGLTHGYVRDLECLSIDKTPLLETIGKFADALEIDIRQLFDNVDLDEKK